MLRINVNTDCELTSLIVEGKLMGPWVKEFEACWQSVINKRPDDAIEINLAAVSFIDESGRVLLTRMCRQGVKIITTGLLIKAIITEIETSINRENRDQEFSY